MLEAEVFIFATAVDKLRRKGGKSANYNKSYNEVPLYASLRKMAPNPLVKNKLSMREGELTLLRIIPCESALSLSEYQYSKPSSLSGSSAIAVLLEGAKA